MQSNTFVDVAASVAAVAAGAALLYARASAHAARDAVAAAERTVKLAEMSRQAAERARLRRRVERVGELVQEVVTAAAAEAGTDELSQKTRERCSVLSRAVIGLTDFLPKAAELGKATSPVDLDERARHASREVDGALKKLNRYRRQSTYRPRHQPPWHRPSRVGSAMAAGGGAGRSRITRPPSP